MKKISSPHNYKQKILSPKYKIGKPSVKFIIKWIKINSRTQKYKRLWKQSAKDLRKALRGSRPRLGIKKSKLKEIKEYFYNLRH